MNRAIFAVSLFLLAGSMPSAWADAPGLLTYQGRVQENGVPVTGNRTVDIQLCDSSSGGSCYSNGAQSVGVQNGLFRSTFTAPSGANLNTGVWYVQIVVNGANLSPREQFTSSPYALVASSAATLAVSPTSPGATVSTNVFILGSLGVGTASPDNQIQVVNLVNFDNAYPGTFLGYQAGHSHAQETAGTLIGYQAGYNLATMGTNLGYGGSGNISADTALGYQALYSDTDNAGNTAIGYKALYANNSTTWPQASDNTAVGASSLLSNGIGTGNSALGASSLFSNTSGNNNIAIGGATMASNTTGSNNTAIGAGTMNNGSNNTNSVAVGMSAGSGVLNNSYADNAIVGYASGFGLTTGSNDTLLGYEAGYSLISGNGNIEIGNDADAIPAASSNMLNIGNLIFGTGVNGTGSSLSTGNVGIGSTSPTQKLDVAGIVNAQGFSVNGVSISSFAAGTSQWTTSGTSIYYSSGDVGIGTSNPNNVLQVANLVDFDNTFTGTILGYEAGHTHAQDTGETYVGYQAGYNIGNMGTNLGLGGGGDIGANTAIGFQALYSDTDNSGNTALGYKALYSNNSATWPQATENTAVGTNAIYSNTTGSGDVALGGFALYSNTSGNQNIAIGNSSMNNNTTGSNDTAIGQGSMNNGGGDSNSVAIGMSAGSGVANNSYADNTMVGYSSGFGLTTGSNETLMGYEAGSSLTSGNGNIEIGNDADAIPAASSNMLNIGNLIFGTGVNGTGSTLSTGNVGIGSTSPTQKLDVAGIVNAQGFTINGVSISSASGGTSQWTTSGSSIYYSGGNVGIGTASPGGLFQVAGGTLTVLSNGYVGIGTLSPQADLDVYSPVSGAYSARFSSFGKNNIDLVANNGTSESFNGINFDSYVPSQSGVRSVGLIQMVTGGHMALYTSQDGAISGTERMRITATGSIGIGTSSPSQLLDVAGVVNAQGFSVNGVSISSFAAGTSQWTTSGTSIYYSSGDVGIGTSNPDNLLQVANLVNFDNTYPGSFLGYQAGHSHAQETAETLIGYQAGYNLANMGTNLGLGGGGNLAANTALGYQALYSDTDNAGNTAIGYQALYSNNSTTWPQATENTAVGTNAMRSNGIGTNNVGLGGSALYSNTSGNQNVSVGNSSMNNNTTGSNDTAIGLGAMNNGSNDSNSVAIGVLAGSGITNNSYSDNAIVGYSAGLNLSTGSNNSLLGYEAGYSLGSGGGSIEIGNDADAIPAASSNMLDIGNLIFATGVNGTGSTLSTGNVGLGTKAPQQKLDVAGNISESGVFISSGTGNSYFMGNVGLGTTNPAWPMHAYGGASVGNVGMFETLGATQIELRSSASSEQNTTLSFASWSNAESGLRQMGALQFVPGGHLLIYTSDDGAISSAERMRVTASGNVGIGTSTPAAKLHVSGGDLQVGDSGAPKGITLYDQTNTSSAYCLTVNNGSLAVSAGACP